MFERFTDRAKKVMALANQEAQRFNHEYLGTEHILLGLVKEGSGVAANVLKNMDIDLRKLRLEVEKLVRSGPDMVTASKLPQTPRAKQVIVYATEESKALNHNYIGTEHLLLGLLREYDGVAAQVLMNLGLKLDDVREETLALLGEPVPPGPGAATHPDARLPLGPFSEHRLVRQYIHLIAEHCRWRDRAVRLRQYEEACVWRDLIADLEMTLKSLYRQIEKDPSFGTGRRGETSGPQEGR